MFTRHVIFLDTDGHIDLSLVIVLARLRCVLCGQAKGLPLCSFVIGVPRANTWDVSCHLCRKYWLINCFSHNAFN